MSPTAQPIVRDGKIDDSPVVTPSPIVQVWMEKSKSNDPVRIGLAVCGSRVSIDDTDEISTRWLSSVRMRDIQRRKPCVDLGGARINKNLTDRSFLADWVLTTRQARCRTAS